MKRKKIEGKYYFIDTEYRVFSLKGRELVGIFNPDTKKIEQGDDQFDNSSVNEESDSEDDLFDSDIEE